MELRQLRYFEAVARHGHFGRAAEEVYVTQSALSQQIGRLEAELGVALLSRTPKGVELTPAGAELNEHAEAVLARVEVARAAIDAHRGAARGAARIAATPQDSARLPSALVAFHRAHPEIQVSLRHGSPGTLAELLRTKAVDVALLGVEERVPRLPAGVVARTVSEEPLRLVCPRGDPLAGASGVAVDALRGVPAVLPERGSALRDVILRACELAGFSPLPLFETSDAPTVFRLVAEGLAYSAAPASWVSDQGPGVGVASFADPALRYRVALVHGEALTPVGALLVDELSERLTGSC